MASRRGRKDEHSEAQLTLSQAVGDTHELRAAAENWLRDTLHREGCQCHRCLWARGVCGGRVRLSFDDWRRRT